MRGTAGMLAGLVVGVAIFGFGVWLLQDDGAQPGETTFRGTVIEVTEGPRQDGRARPVYSHVVRFDDSETGSRVVESRTYFAEPPAVGSTVEVYLGSGSDSPRVSTPKAKRDGYIAMVFGAAVLLFSLSRRFR